MLTVNFLEKVLTTGIVLISFLIETWTQPLGNLMEMKSPKRKGRQNSQCEGEELWLEGGPGRIVLSKLMCKNFCLGMAYNPLGCEPAPNTNSYTSTN